MMTDNPASSHNPSLHDQAVRAPSVYTIGPAHSFVDALARSLLDQYGDQPLALGAIQILLPNRRSARSLREAFLRNHGGRPMLLPRMLAIGDVDEDALDITAPASDLIDLRPAISDTDRLFYLTRLCLQIPENHGRPGSMAAALKLARDLARLIDSVHTERLDFSRLKELVPEKLAHHWQNTLKFLEVITDQWPRLLDHLGQCDPAERRNGLLAALTQKWQTHPPRGLVIAAGSTGSIPATADLLALVARLPKGCVILPGFDRSLDDDLWQALDPGHPQFLMKALLDHMRVSRHEVENWPLVKADQALESQRADRLLLINSALLPAKQVDRWNAISIDHQTAKKGLERIDCDGLSEEAGVIALLLREALDHPEKRAALVTPDRALARQVRAHLARWDIAIDDSAGDPAERSLSGSFLRLTLSFAADPGPINLLALLKHPLAAAGMKPSALRQLARRLDRHESREGSALRGPRPEASIDGMEKAAADAGVDEADLGLLNKIFALLRPLESVLHSPSLAVGDLLSCHLDVAQNLAQSHDQSGADRLWRGEAGEHLAQYLAKARAGIDCLGATRGKDYPAFFHALITDQMVRPRYGMHPRLAILGPIEARLHHVDLMILGGLNEGTWPANPGHDPWASRAMRKDFGLPDPDQRIGQSAHDLVQAMGAPHIILTRSGKVDGTPSVPSRWLSRLEALAPYLDGRKSPMVRLYQALDQPDKIEPIDAPRPMPPLSARPRSLSVTQVELWVRDPYALYARHILKLRPLEDLEAEPGALHKGTIWHQALDDYKRRAIPTWSRDEAYKALIECGKTAFGPLLERPSIWAFWWPRFQTMGRRFLEIEEERRDSHETIATEIRGEWPIHEGPWPFTLKARADRLDRERASGHIEIIDYKTGSPPQKRRIEAGFAPQLPLEGVMVNEGAFNGLLPCAVAGLSFWQLRGTRDPIEIKHVAGHDEQISASRAGFLSLLARFSKPHTPYLSNPRPANTGYGDYDHLARTAEWTRLPDLDDLPMDFNGHEPIKED
ncbi:double-strand break repair protein AddB [Iodidimonas nitroreducens]|uniref:Double-strand break repair protein AddB n=1 Tax=Iodidimonas nitroreducens TaxID=1236968 RepID=A0A5A7NAT6_9PROT|nr:double-strand break repair protein AddB [Iodidimonas nitroreducens]GER05362.1 double-strand break repair protein AddB [Iodidimonas nitroreducens]